MKTGEEYHIPMGARVLFVVIALVLAYLYYLAGPYTYAENFPIE